MRPPKAILLPALKLVGVREGRRERIVSLCMAAACESGRYAVITHDGRLVYGSQTADVFAPKMQWFIGKTPDASQASRAPVDWVFMFAGKLSSTELIMEQVRLRVFNDAKTDPLARANIQSTVVQAFNKRVARWSGLRHVSMYGMDMDRFLKEGPTSFSKKVHSELVRAIYNDARLHFDDEILVIGWGKKPLAVMLYSVSAEGDNAGAKDASCAIGSGKHRAISTLVKLQHGLFSSLQDTIYSVAAAKFSAESRYVGKDTTMYIVRKRVPQDDPDKPPQIIIEQDYINELRAVWKNHKGRGVPVEAKRIAARIVELTGDKAAISRGAADILMDELGRATRQSASRKSGAAGRRRTR